jgi:hypothetical protein
MTSILPQKPPPVIYKCRWNLLVKILSLFVTAAGLTIMAGWIFDIGVLKSLSPSWVSMKFSTAVAFAASGVSLFYIVRVLEGEFDMAQIVLSLASLTITLLMGVMFFSAVFGIPTGIENLFIKETGEIKSVVPGRPSVPTMINFLLIALAAILTLQHPVRLRPKLKTIGIIVGLTGALAAAGYLFNAPLLYYYIAGVNSAMALHTSLLFVILGTGLVCL